MNTELDDSIFGERWSLNVDAYLNDVFNKIIAFLKEFFSGLGLTEFFEKIFGAI